MANKLYKVNVEVDVYVVADGLSEAASVAKLYAGNEVEDFALAHASEVNSAYEIPDDWKTQVPYSKNNAEFRSCAVIMESINKAVEKTEVQEEGIHEETQGHKTEDQPPHEDLPVEISNKNNDLPKLRFKI